MSYKITKCMILRTTQESWSGITGYTLDWCGTKFGDHKATI